MLNLIIDLLLFSIISTEILASEDHAQALKNFVSDHPHLHDLVDKARAGDLDSKQQFELEALSVRFNATRERLPANTDEEHVVLHFLDDYTAHVSGSSDHKFMELEPLVALLGEHDDLRERLIKLGKMLERAECDFACLGDTLSVVLGRVMSKLQMDHTEL